MPQEINYRWQVKPILKTHYLAADIPLIEASILDVQEKKIIPELLRKLPFLPPEFGHLKRVNKGQILIGIGEDLTDRENLKEILKIEPQIFTCQVPRYKPKTKKHNEFSKKYWPSKFHKDAILESKLDGTFFTKKQLKQIDVLFQRVEPKKAALFYDPLNESVVCECTANPLKPLCHPVMACIETLSSRLAKNVQIGPEQYLGTGFDAILAEEPCTMCAMAMVHCRIKRVFFGSPNEKCGALMSKWRLQETSDLNHHFEVYQIIEIKKAMLLKWLKKLPSTGTADEKQEIIKENEEDVRMRDPEEQKENQDGQNGETKNATEQEDGDMMENADDEQHEEAEEEVIYEHENKRKLDASALELVFPSQQTIKHLVLLNSMALPINYGDHRAPYYRSVLKNRLADDDFVQNDSAQEFRPFWSKMAYYRNSLVGAITLSREELMEQKSEQSSSSSSTDQHFQVIIITLAVLPSFRRRGVGTALIEDAIQQCKRWGNVKKISLNCQSSNEIARSFYMRHNFVEAEFLPNYYGNGNSRIAEPDAHRLELNLPRRKSATPEEEEPTGKK